METPRESEDGVDEGKKSSTSKRMESRKARASRGPETFEDPDDYFNESFESFDGSLKASIKSDGKQGTRRSPINNK